MRRIFLTAFAVLLCAAAALGDVLHLRDGSRVEGKLTSCDEEYCSIDKRRVLIQDIERITLGAAGDIPAEARGGGVVLSDGTVRRGKFTGLTLGYVEVGGEEIDRENVTAIVLVAKKKADVIIGVDGNQRAGDVTACNAASCTVAGQTIAFGAIRWIGLAQGMSVPPAAADKNLVFTIDQESIEARLSGIDASTVRTTRGSFARGKVTWIRLALAVAEAPARPPIIRPPADPPTGSAPPDRPITDPPRDQPPPTTNPPPPPPPPRGRQTSVGSRVWIGQMQGYMWGSDGDGREDLRIFVDVRLTEIGLRQSTDRSGKKLADIIMLSSAGTVVRNTHRFRGPNERCDGEGTTTVAPEYPGTSANFIYRKTGSDSLQPLLGFDIPSGKQLYMLLLGPVNPPIPFYPRVCTDVDTGTRTMDWTYLVPMVGTLPPGTVSFDPELRYLQDGKMIGSYTGPGSEHTYTNVSLSWSICLEGTVCPPLAPPSGPVDNEPLPPRDLPPDHDWCAELQRLIAMMRALPQEWERYKDAFDVAEAERDKARDEIWGRNGTLRKYFTAMLGLAATKAGDKLRKVIETATPLMEEEFVNFNTVWELFDTLYDPKDKLLQAARKEGVRAALEKAADYEGTFPGDDAGGLRAYAESIGNSESLTDAVEEISEGLDVAIALKDYVEETDALWNSITEYEVNRQLANHNKALMDGINERQRDLQFQIEEARRRCAQQQQGSRHSGRPEFLRVSLRSSTPLFAAQDSGTPPSDTQALATRLLEVKQQLEPVPAEYKTAAIWLLPFLARQTEGVSPKLLKLLVGQALPHLQRAQTAFESATVDQQQFQRDLEKTIPKQSATKPGNKK